MSDISRELVIRVTRDDSEAKAKAAAYWAAELEGQRKATAAAKSKGDVDKAAAKAKADAASEADRLIKQMDKATADRQKADARARVARARETSAAVRQADKVMSDLILSDLKALQAADAALAKARKESAAEVAKVIRQVETQTAADKRQWDKRELTDAEIHQRGVSAIIRKANRERVQDFVASHGKEKGLLDDLKSAWGGPLGAIAKAGGAVAGVTVGMGALKDVAVAALTAMDEKTRQFAESTRDATQAILERHRAELEAAGFAGTPGETGAELTKTAKLAAETGLDLAGASALRSAVGAGTFGVVDRPGAPGLISEEDLDKATTLAGKQAAYSGGDPTAYGQAVAMIPAIEGRRVGADEIESHLLRLDRLANVGGFNTPGDLVGKVKDIRGYIQAGVLSSGEGEAMVALAARRNPEAAATVAKQGVTAASAGALMARGVHVEDDMKDQTMKLSAYFKSIGIGLNAGPIQTSKAISDDLAKLGPDVNPDQYLLSRGMTNQQSREWFLGFHGDRAIWEKEIEPLLKNQAPPGTIAGIHAEFQKSPLGKGNAVKVGGEIAQAAVGAKFGDLNLAMQDEYNRQLAAGKEMSPLAEYMAPPSRNALFGTFSPQEIYRSFKGTTQEELLAPIGMRLDKELDRLGISMDAVFKDEKGRPYGRTFSSPGSMLSSGEASFRDVNRVFSEAIGKIQAAGGDATLGQGQAVQDMVAELRGLRDDMKRERESRRPTVPRAVDPAPARLGNPH